ncbi:hypothetical protein SK128_027465 [Halocaridina rubra]|uniref:Uncharacterized protein n=1 Tax=Halocaridina rubra TaxID=373956 RepID=A0AAN8WLF4_HALRR
MLRNRNAVTSLFKKFTISLGKSHRKTHTYYSSFQASFPLRANIFQENILYCSNTNDPRQICIIEESN